MELISHKEADRRGKIIRSRETRRSFFNLNNEVAENLPTMPLTRIAMPRFYFYHGSSRWSYSGHICQRKNPLWLAKSFLFCDYRYEPADRAPAWARKPEADGRGKKLCHEFMAHVWNFFSTMQVSSTVRTNEESDLLVPVVEHVSSLQKMVCPYFFVQLYGQYSQFPNRGRPSNVVWHLCASRGYGNPWQGSSSIRETHSMDRVSFFAFEYTIY